MELIQVPCCEDCRTGTSLGDEALKVMVGMGVLRTETAIEVSNDVLVALQKPSWWKKELQKSVIDPTSNQATSIHGVLGHKIRLTPKFSESVDQAVRRTAIGVIFRYLPDWNNLNYDFKIVGKSEDELQVVADALTQLGEPQHKVEVGNGAFIAGWSFTTDGSNAGMMFMSFHGGLNFFIFIKPKGSDILR
ncbi:MAG: hypothetical protein QM755_03490 [Luteolibacter sp.]